MPFDPTIAAGEEMTEEKDKIIIDADTIDIDRYICKFNIPDDRIAAVIQQCLSEK